ncbi:MAG: hypothetical protein HBSAPP03_28950 [Phycisphaerae bacterium]|nr:MAG: hypothetical protein HBSAPP03_28950 [Phycisphaerae bacterium]
MAGVRRPSPPNTGSSASREASRTAIARAITEQNKAKATPAPPSTGADRSLLEPLRPTPSGRGDSGTLPHQTMVDRARQLRDERVGTGSVPPAPFTGVERNAQERDGWSGSSRDRDGDHRGGNDWNQRDRDDRHDRYGWNRRDRGRWDSWDRDCDDDGWRSGWSFGLSIGSGGWGLSASYGWGLARDCGPTYVRWHDWRPRRYVYDACDYRWDWCSPVVVRTSWHRPLASVCCWESCHSSFHSAWCHKTLVTTYVPVYFTTSVAGYGTVGSVQTFVNDGYAGVTPVAVAAPASIAIPPSASRSASVAVTYRANEKAGVLDWADTPTRIVGALQDAPESMRGELAGRYLGRTVAGAWELIVERVQPSGDRTMLVCSARGASDRPSPIVALMMDGTPSGLKEGAIIVASGRIVEVTLNDPDAPSGVMVLDDVKIAR